ncbi:MAG TPA: hypothetical protein VLX09_08705 [Stellaceae bacterium]|nr:hypothetical protein [Stellaceae bacterium]
MTVRLITTASALILFTAMPGRADPIDASNAVATAMATDARQSLADSEFGSLATIDAVRLLSTLLEPSLDPTDELNAASPMNVEHTLAGLGFPELDSPARKQMLTIDATGSPSESPEIDIRIDADGLPEPPATSGVSGLLLLTPFAVLALIAFVFVKLTGLIFKPHRHSRSGWAHLDWFGSALWRRNRKTPPVRAEASPHRRAHANWPRFARRT